jgi:tRNA modification GTPase
LQRSIEVIRARSSAPRVAVRTKADVAVIPGASSRSGAVSDAIAVSATERTGLTDVLEAIRVAASDDRLSGIDVGDDVIVTRERQRRGLEAARAEVDAFRAAWESKQLPAVIAAVHLQAATEALNEIIGAVTVEDILDRVFRDFCVGK